MKKICRECKVGKSITECEKTGNICKLCRKNYNAKYREQNKEKLKLKNKLWVKQNKEKTKQYQDNYRKENKEKLIQDYKIFYQNNKEKILAKGKKYFEENRDSCLAVRRKWDKKRRQRTDIKLGGNISRRIHEALRENKQGKHWETLVGYTINQLKIHLESKFQIGMTWENYGLHGWHVDHIIPRSTFKFETYDCDDFKKCWALSNLQPLWAKDNLTKGNKILPS